MIKNTSGSDLNLFSEYTDKLIVRGLNARSVVGGDHWARPKLQPILLDIVYYTNVEACGDSDLLAHSLSYSELAVKATEVAESETHTNVFELAKKICNHLLITFQGYKVTIIIQKPKGLLHAETSGIEITRTRDYITSIECHEEEKGADHIINVVDFFRDDRVFINGLRLNAIIGIHPWEREAKQVVLIHLTLYPGATVLGQNYTRQPQSSRDLVNTISDMIEPSSFKTVEALATSIARAIIVSCGHPKVTVRVEKPSALRFAAAAAAEITRDAHHFAEELIPDRGIVFPCDYPSKGDEIITLIAVGSNLQDRYQNISSALAKLKAAGCSIIETSFLYETAPMYVTDQPKFLNAVCKVSTRLEPLPLLDLLKSIEEEVGRVPTLRNGPRLIDLDILDYNGIALETPRLTLPHIGIAEREFVLRPLCDLCPEWEHPHLKRTASQLLDRLMHGQAHSDVIKVIPFPGGVVWPCGVKTYIMGILNVTPDSFSDGGELVSVEDAVKKAKDLIKAGADILDIGGESTRPGATEVSVADELSRVLPVIKQLRKDGIECPISIDTYHAEVAEQAISAGANFINDISGATRDPEMLNVMAANNVPVCLMHTRGNSQTMNSLCNYEEGRVMQTVLLELGQCVSKAMSAGVYRWNIVIDPGLGFAKDAAQNLELLRNLGRLDNLFPYLVGTSRKKFLGEITGKAIPNQRSWATAATCTSAIASGAAILRVHDVAELRDVVLVSDKIYRFNRSQK